MGSSTFSACPGLTNVTLGTGVVSIGYQAFNGSSVRTIVFPASLRSLADSAFYSCRELTSVAFSNSAVAIGNSAFAGCTNLASVDFGNSVVSIGSYAFANCPALRNVVLPDSLSSLDLYTFSACSTLTSVTLGHGITNVSYSAFLDCVSLTNVTLGRSVIDINWLGNLSALSTLTVDVANPLYSGVDNVLFDKGTNRVLHCPDGKAGSFTIPDSVTSIGDFAFSGCVLLSHITLGNSITNIGSWAFDGCSSLTNIIIPSSVQEIGPLAFGSCGSLLEIAVDALNPDFSSLNGVLFNHSRTVLMAYPPGKAGEYTVPSSVSLIDDYAFAACSALTDVTIGRSVTRLGAYAFEGCTQLREIFVPNSITNIGPYAFSACGNSLPSFVGFSAVIENGVRSIAPGMFRLCANLDLITIPNTVTNIGGVAFEGCSRLRSVTLPEGVISVDFSAFEDCTELRQVVLPETLTTVGNRAFFNSGLTNLTMPSSVKRIGNQAFLNCYDLRGVHFQGDSPQLPPFAQVFEFNITIYYLPGTLGWSTTYNNCPTAHWALPHPIILTRSPSFGVRTNQFGFRVSWATNTSVVLQASTNLAEFSWMALRTNSLASGWTYFSDPEWTNHPTRIYRVREL